MFGLEDFAALSETDALTSSLRAYAWAPWQCHTTSLLWFCETLCVWPQEATLQKRAGRFEGCWFSLFTLKHHKFISIWARTFECSLRRNIIMFNQWNHFSTSSLSLQPTPLPFGIYRCRSMYAIHIQVSFEKMMKDDSPSLQQSTFKFR